MTSPPMAKAHAEHVRQLEMQAGDCVVFSEATTHGALPWSAAHERRSLIVRYCPGNNAAAGPDWKWPMDWPAEWLEGMGSTPESCTVKAAEDPISSAVHS